MSGFILTLLGAALVNNIVVVQVIGSDPALAYLRKMDVARGMAVTIAILLPAAALLGHILEAYLFTSPDLQYIRLPVFVLVALLLAWSLKLWGRRTNSRIMDRINIFLPLAGINTTVLGALLLNLQLANDLTASFAFGLGTALGFGIILFMLVAISERLEAADIPAPFQGMSILLVTLALTSMGFMGFTGLIAS